MGLAQLIQDTYSRLLGGVAPSGAASSTGDISQMVKYLIANPASFPDFPKFLEPAQQSVQALPAGVSTAIGAANRCIFIPIPVKRAGTVVRLYVCNGATAAGNIAMALYDGTGARIAAPAAAAQVGATAFQRFTVSVNVTPGIYWIAFSSDNATSTYRNAIPAAGPDARLINAFYANTNHPPPATLPAPDSHHNNYAQMGISFDANFPITVW